MSVDSSILPEIDCPNEVIAGRDLSSNKMSDFVPDFDIDLDLMENSVTWYPSVFELPKDYNPIINRIDEVLELIKSSVATKKDVTKSTTMIIQHQKQEISELKEFIKDLAHELEKRSISNILMWISLTGSLLSVALLFISIFNTKVILLPIHFMLLSLVFLIVLIMTFYSKKEIHQNGK